MSQLHAAVGMVVLGTSAIFALLALGSAAVDLPSAWLDRFRLAIAAIVVIAAATGVILALNDGPAETIHWLYGAVIVALPVIAAGVDVGNSSRLRAAVYCAAGIIMALIAWRLAGTG
jgi:multisubunit Na+/H+ antiporter MnhB subunit